MNSHTECIIVGAGSAGAGAALQLEREGVEFLLLDKTGNAGGLIENARSVDNCVWVPARSPGSSVAGLIRNRLNSAGIGIVEFDVKRITQNENSTWTVTGDDAASISSSALILAAGTRPVNLRGVRKCKNITFEIRDLEIPDSDESRDLRIVVVGGGDVAFDGALNLADRGINTHILVRGPEYRANESLKKEIAASGLCSLHLNTSVDSITKTAEGVIVNARKPDGPEKLHADGALICIGRRSSLEDISVIARSNRSPAELEEEGLFLAGDIHSGRLRQVTIASGDGVRQAMHAAEFLRIRNT